MKLLILTCTFVFSAMAGFSQKETTANTEKELKKLSNDWMIAAMKRDAKTLDKIVAPEFKLGGTKLDGPTISRDIWMTNTMEKLKIDSVNYINMKFDVMENIAIIQSTFYWSVAFAEFPPEPDTVNLIDTWVKKEKGWQVVSRIVVD